MKTYKTNLNELTIKRNPTDFKRVKITSSRDSETYLRNFYLDDLTIYESFFYSFLTTKTIQLVMLKYHKAESLEL